MATLTIPVGDELVTYDLDAETATVGGVSRPATDAELGVIRAEKAARAAAPAEAAARAAIAEARDELVAAVELAAFYPMPTPEETAIVDAQVAVALDLFRALADPPADVVALAATVVAWRIEL